MACAWYIVLAQSCSDAAFSALVNVAWVAQKSLPISSQVHVVHGLAWLAEQCANTFVWCNTAHSSERVDAQLRMHLQHQKQARKLASQR